MKNLTTDKALAAISVVIPVYNSEAFLRELYERLRAVFDEIGRDYEIIMVEDCGRDGSWDVIVGLSRNDERVRGIKLNRNFGQHNALLCGIRAVKYDLIVTIDDDLQHPPEEIPKLLERLEDGYDVVYGTPLKMEHGFWRKIASTSTKFVMRWSMGVKTATDVSAFRAFRARLCGAFSNYHDSLISIDVLLSWGTTAFSAVPVEHHVRREGASGYTLKKLATHALNMMTGYSTVPLRLASMAGFLVTIFGVLVLAYVVGRYIIHGSGVPGFPFLASIISVFAGAQLFALGIIGEYLALLHFRTLNKPMYLIRETTGSENDKDKRGST